jgi:hypothetical protein
MQYSAPPRNVPAIFFPDFSPDLLRFLFFKYNSDIRLTKKVEIKVIKVKSYKLKILKKAKISEKYESQ